jgi:hypothetical protein
MGFVNGQARTAIQALIVSGPDRATGPCDYLEFYLEWPGQPWTRD